MSLDATVWAWRQRPSGSTAKLVLLCLADFASESNVCYPSQNTVAKRCGLSPRAVGDAMRQLEADGLVERTRRMAGTVRLSDQITLHVRRIVVFGTGPEAELAAPADGPAELAGSTPEGAKTAGAKAVGGGAPAAYIEPAPAADKPTIEPSLKPKPGLSIDDLAVRIYNATPLKAQQRTGSGPGRILRALKEQVEAGEPLADMVAAALTYYAGEDQRKEDGKWAATPHIFIEDGRWRAWVGVVHAAPGSPPAATPAAAARPAVPFVEFGGHTYAVPAGGWVGDGEVGTYENPGIRRQLDWVHSWVDVMSWSRAKMGPAPGEPGCRLWPSVCEKYDLPIAGTGA